VVLFSQASDPSLCAPHGTVVRVLLKPNLPDLSVDTVFAACMAVRVAHPKVIRPAAS